MRRGHDRNGGPVAPRPFDGAELTYDDEGPRDAGTAPLVFLHGWTADRHRWDRQTAHFAPTAG